MEYSELYASLFKNHEPYERIVSELGRKGTGLTRGEIAAGIGIPGVVNAKADFAFDLGGRIIAFALGIINGVPRLLMKLLDKNMLLIY